MDLNRDCTLLKYLAVAEGAKPPVTDFNLLKTPKWRIVICKYNLDLLYILFVAIKSSKYSVKISLFCCLSHYVCNSIVQVMFYLS